MQVLAACSRRLCGDAKTHLQHVTQVCNVAPELLQLLVLVSSSLQILLQLFHSLQAVLQIVAGAVQLLLCICVRCLQLASLHAELHVVFSCCHCDERGVRSLLQGFAYAVLLYVGMLEGYQHARVGIACRTQLGAAA